MSVVLHPSENSTSDPMSLTRAPLRYVMTVPVSASQATALDKVLELDRIADYSSSIKKVDLECDASGKTVARQCHISGMGVVMEKIVWLDEELGYAYSVDAPGVPMKDHLAVATVSPDVGGGSSIRWEQYFNWRGTLKPLVMKLMFPRMMKELGKGLQRDLGASGRIEGSWV